MANERDERLRQEEPPYGIDQRESVCPACDLAYWSAAGSWGVCADCGEELTPVPSD